MATNPEVYTGWHFLAEDGKLAYGDNRKPRKGVWYKAKPDMDNSYSGTPTLCEWGMHASPTVLNALQYAPGPILCRVELRENIARGDDKAVAIERRILARIDATKMLHLFACDCAEKALVAAQVTDQRSWNALKVKRLWVEGKATDEELAAARAAAWDAARAAARDAARDAAWDAAWDAARGAAWDAAWDAARAAARNAARDAAWDAAWAAARAEQRQRLEAMAMQAIAP